MLRLRLRPPDALRALSGREVRAVRQPVERFQLVWWWRPSSFYKPLSLNMRPWPNHPAPCPVRGCIYLWIGLRFGPLEIRRWNETPIPRGIECSCGP